MLLYFSLQISKAKNSQLLQDKLQTSRQSKVNHKIARPNEKIRNSLGKISTVF